MNNLSQASVSLPRESSFGPIEKLFVWSVILELLLFFVVASQDVSGIGGNISRLLQFIFIVLFLVRSILRPFNALTIFNPFNKYFRWYLIYFIFLAFSMVFGFSVGAYDLYNSRLDSDIFINSSLVRPIFEYFITLYYFIYFAVLPIFILRSKKGIDYFFKIFFFLFFLSFFLGAVDLALVVFFQYEFIPRHLSDFRHVGMRFHGLAGEPRDAFVYLILGGALLFLREIWTGIKFHRGWLFLIFFAALATQSTSGYLGFFMSIAMIFLYQIRKMKMGPIIFLLIVAISALALIFLSIINSPRTILYIEAAPVAFEALQNGVELPGVIMAQIVNIYPLWIRWIELLDNNFLSSFLGTGLGTASIANGYILTEGGVLNPHANIIRIFFESGFIGILLYIASFLQPLREASRKIEKANIMIAPMFMVLGASFGHRSVAIFIFLGITLLVLIHKTKYSRQGSIDDN